MIRITRAVAAAVFAVSASFGAVPRADAAQVVCFGRTSTFQSSKVFPIGNSTSGSVSWSETGGVCAGGSAQSLGATLGWTGNCAFTTLSGADFSVIITGNNHHGIQTAGGPQAPTARSQAAFTFADLSGSLCTRTTQTMSGNSTYSQ